VEVPSGVILVLAGFKSRWTIPLVLTQAAPASGLRVSLPGLNRVSYTHACTCGFYGNATRECRCTPALIQHYLGKIGGPLLDRHRHLRRGARRAVPGNCAAFRSARTIADFTGSETVSAMHAAEAVPYRSIHRNYWT
jgi:hypothetical protein